MFNVFTDVPLPGRFFGLNNDDLTFSTDPKSLLFGEKAGDPVQPDRHLRLHQPPDHHRRDRLQRHLRRPAPVDQPDQLPDAVRRVRATCTASSATTRASRVASTSTTTRTTGRSRPTSRPSRASSFPADTAPTQVGVSVTLPSGQAQVGLSCPVNDPAAAGARTPRAVRRLAAVRHGTARRRLHAQRQGLRRRHAGAAHASTARRPLPRAPWTDTQITVSTVCRRQLSARTSCGSRPANGKTTDQRPHLPPARGPATTRPSTRSARAGPYAARQAHCRQVPTTPSSVPSTRHASGRQRTPPAPWWWSTRTTPSANPRQNPRGAYYENLIISKRVKLQGVGPGSPDGSVSAARSSTAAPSPATARWRPTGTRRSAASRWAGNQTIYDGAVISLYLPSGGRNAFPTGSYNASDGPVDRRLRHPRRRPDGLPRQRHRDRRRADRPAGRADHPGRRDLRQRATPATCRSPTTSSRTTAAPTGRSASAPRTCRPANNQNDGVRIANNRILNNAGTNLAGGIGIFAGADGYVVRNNDICGNFSAEYGGGISQYGLQPQRARSTTTASTTTSPTTRAAGS